MTPFTTIFVIAKNALKECIRDRVLYAIFVFAAVFIAYALFLSSLSLGEDLHVMRSLGLAGIYLLGLVIAVFLGTSLVYKEFEQRTLYFILAKPLTRGQFLIGKFFGLYLSVALSIAGMAIVYLSVVLWMGGGFDYASLLALFFELLELALLVALTIFFSTFAKPLTSTVYALLIVYIGHSLSQLVAFTDRASSTARYITKILYYILPNLEKFDIRDAIIYGSHPSLIAFVSAILYAVLYVSILLYASVLLIRKREL